MKIYRRRTSVSVEQKCHTKLESLISSRLPLLFIGELYIGIPLPAPLLFRPIVMVPEGVPPLRAGCKFSLEPVTEGPRDLGRVDPTR